MIKFDLQDLYSDCFHKMTLNTKLEHTIASTRFLCWPLTLGLHKILPSILNVIWHMHLGSLKLLCPMIKEEIIFQENTLLELWPWHQGHMKYCPVSSKSWNLCTCNVWSCYVQGFGRRCIYKKIHYMTLSQYVLDLSQGHTKCSSVPSTSCDLCTCIVWSYYVERFGRRCIYKKIHYVTFDLDIGVKVTQNVAQYSLHHVIYAATPFEVATSNGLGGDTFTSKYILWPWPCVALVVKVTRNVALYPLHHVTYAAVNVWVATSHS